MTIQEVDSLTQERFLEALGFVFENSPWVAERASAKRPFGTIDALCAAMTGEVERADRKEQLALLRAHPDLGARAKMSNASADEQHSAGLDKLTPHEYATLQALNTSYRMKFGYPFIFAVQGSTKHEILKALEERTAAAPEAEFQEALRQVFRIARFRLESLVTPRGDR